MAKVWNKRKSKIQNEEANVELIAPYAAPAPKSMLGIFCLPWSTTSSLFTTHEKEWGEICIGEQDSAWKLFLSQLSLPEVITLTDFGNNQVIVISNFNGIAAQNNHGVVHNLVNLGTNEPWRFRLGICPFALRKQFLRMICHIYDWYSPANIVVPKANPDDAKSVTIKDDKDLAEIFSGNHGSQSSNRNPKSNPNQKDPNQPQGPGNFGPYGPYGGPYGQYPPPPYGQGPYGQYPPGPYGYPPNFQQQQQQAPATPTPEPSSSLAVPRPEQIPERSREVSIAASTLTTTTTAPSTSVAPTPQNPNIISVGPNPYELQAMLERLMPKEREREREQEKERPQALILLR
ncbi:Protein lifeguard 1 [Orchesella cincta]|uniref:Protein lifeguard 1 n=1 Tax=Orchesella cincta TaxID=48709 RepID=A0A1D2N0C9_ORCCI|nr:Protein lifeguard 1 [Orchesella cincta]